MLRRIIILLCLAGAVQVVSPMQGHASTTQSTLYGNADHLPAHILHHLLKEAANHWGISYKNAEFAYRNWDLVITETEDSHGDRACLISYDGGDLLAVIQDML